MRLAPLAAAVAVLCTSLLCAAELPVIDPARVTERTLPNGLKLVIKEERQWPVVALGAYIRAGSLHELPNEIGAAHLVEHMLFEATGDDTQKLAPFIEGMGGRLSATTLRDFTHVDAVVASRYLERVLPTLLKAVFEAQFTEQQVMRERAVVKREIAERRDRLDLYLDEMIWRLAYDQHPYGRPIGGGAADLDRLTYDTLRQFYRRFYVPNNVTLLVVGDVDPAWLEGRVKELTAEYPSRPITWTEPRPDAALTQSRVKAETVSRSASLFSFGWRAPSIADKADVCATDLIYTILGQEGVGRLPTRLVNEQKLLLSVEVEFLTQKAPGLLLINGLAPCGHEEEAQAAVLAEVQRLSEEPVSEHELNRAKRLLYAEYAFSNESYDDQVGSMGFYASIDDFRFALNYIGQVMKTTPEQIQKTARAYLRSNNYSLAILRGKKSDKEEETAMLP